MKKKFDDYTWLARGGLFGSSLWEGPDHLLYITSSFVGERYRRIDYAKIQAISYGRTSTYGWTIAWQGVLLALFAWGLLANLHDGVFPIAFFGTLTALLLVIFILNLVRGPTCLCKIQTAVQVLRLNPLRRIRPTMNCVARIQELCRVHQGDATPPPAMSAANALAGAPLHAVPGVVKPPFHGSTMLAITLPLMAFSGMMLIADLFIRGLWFFGLDAMVTMVAVGLTIAGIARALRTHLPDALRISLWGLGGTILFQLLVAFMVYIASIFQQTHQMVESGSGQFDLLGPWQWMADAGFAELGWIAWFVVAAGAAAIVFSVIGMPTVFQPKTAPIAPVTPPPTPPTIGPAANEPASSESPPP